MRLLSRRALLVTACALVALAIPLAAPAAQDSYLCCAVTINGGTLYHSINAHVYQNVVYHSDAQMNSAIVRSSDGAILTEQHSSINPVRVSISTPSYNTRGTCHAYPNLPSTVVHTVTCNANYSP